MTADGPSAWNLKRCSRSTGERRLTWVGAGCPLTAMWAANPRVLTDSVGIVCPRGGEFRYTVEVEFT